MTIYTYVRFALMICLGINSGIFGGEKTPTKPRCDSAPLRSFNKLPIPSRAASDSLIHTKGESQKCKELRSAGKLILGAGDIEFYTVSGDETESDEDINDSNKGLLPDSYLKQREQARAVPIAMNSKKETDTTEFVAPKLVRVRDIESAARIARLDRRLEAYKARKSSRVVVNSSRGFVAAEAAKQVRDENEDEDELKSPLSAKDGLQFEIEL